MQTSGTKSHVLVPDTEANNSSTVELCNLPGEGGEKDTCQCAPKRGFESPAVEPRGLECEDKRPGEQAHEESVLNAFGSLPSFSTVLKQYKSSVLKANQSGLQVASSGLLTHVDGEASAATGRKASNIPTPQPEDFDSEPSDLLLMKSDNAKSPPSTAQDEENLPHDHQPPPHPLRTDGFLSKEFGRKIASRDEGAENEVNVWPVYYKHDANIPEQPSLPQPPAKVTLAPFLPGSKLDAEDRTCNIDTLDQPRDDHSAQIDMLFK
ncbi:unnamed protein product [Mesocestoides corti]|uniref:Uncharacterized protein n=1 Tax=Mesocestoides corti TaxID=53468 RepID=A0A3P6H7D4_MESCO|nr:unnamed protein product [Mesocestoides corti]